jgi:hypothetical protein
MNRHNHSDRRTGPILAELAKIVSEAPRSPFIAPGARRIIAGREFVAVAVEPYKARNGDSQLVTWRGHCATCSAAYEARGSRSATGLPLNCAQHRGRRTRHSKRRRESENTIELAVILLRRLLPYITGNPTAIGSHERDELRAEIDGWLMIAGEKK